LNIEEKSVGDALRLAGDRLVHVHACENDRGTPGTGHVPWDEVFDALRDVGYDRQLVIESFTPLVKEIARAVSLWRPLDAEGDALAVGGLRFLRGQVL
jgi:D-psicose/D-tagatose/L-ribulose 3-epimerase